MHFDGARSDGSDSRPIEHHRKRLKRVFKSGYQSIYCKSDFDFLSDD